MGGLWHCFNHITNRVPLGGSIVIGGHPYDRWLLSGDRLVPEHRRGEVAAAGAGGASFDMVSPGER